MADKSQRLDKILFEDSVQRFSKRRASKSLICYGGQQWSSRNSHFPFCLISFLNIQEHTSFPKRVVQSVFFPWRFLKRGGKFFSLSPRIKEREIGSSPATERWSDEADEDFFTALSSCAEEHSLDSRSWTLWYHVRMLNLIKRERYR